MFKTELSRLCWYSTLKVFAPLKGLPRGVCES